MVRIALTLGGALAALAFSGATARADGPDAPTPIAGTESAVTQSIAPLFEQLQYSQDFSVLNAPDETFEGVVRLGTNLLGLDSQNVSVLQDIVGNVPVGEQYNDVTFNDSWGEVYNSIGGTPEAFYTTPFGDLNFPTWFVDAAGPSFFEPSINFWPHPAPEAGLDAPTPVGPELDVSNGVTFARFFEDQTAYAQDFSLPNAPAETFDGAVSEAYDVFGDVNENVVVLQDIAGSVPVGEVYNNFVMDGFGLVYNSIGVAPEAFFTTPFGDLTFPAAFVEAVGPSFFEPLTADWLTADLPALLAALW